MPQIVIDRRLGLYKKIDIIFLICIQFQPPSICFCFWCIVQSTIVYTDYATTKPSEPFSRSPHVLKVEKEVCAHIFPPNVSVTNKII